MNATKFKLVRPLETLWNEEEYRWLRKGSVFTIPTDKEIEEYIPKDFVDEYEVILINAGKSYLGISRKTLNEDFIAVKGGAK